MTTLPAHDDLVQLLAHALQPTLGALLQDRPLLDFFRQGDQKLQHALLQAAAQVAEKALSQPERPPNAAYKKSFTVHSALGPLALVLYGTYDAEGRVCDPIPQGIVRHGCTVAVRERITVLHALGATQEVVTVMGLFQPQTPSATTVHRVAVQEGKELAELFDPETAARLVGEHIAPYRDKVSLIVLGADGGIVPMRGEGDDASRQWREARLATITLLGEPNLDKPRKITLFDGGKHEVEKGFERPVLGTVLLGQMPTLQGPRSERVEQTVPPIVRALREACPDATWQGLCDGGSWPEGLVDAAVGADNRVTDIGHASDHLHKGAEEKFDPGPQAQRWWAKQRTLLLEQPGHAANVAKALQREADRSVDPERGERLETQAGYFAKRVAQMTYPERLERSELIGSGHAESGVKQVFTRRLKVSGASWGHEGGDAVVHARGLVISGMWKRAWQEHIDELFAPYAKVA